MVHLVDTAMAMVMSILRGILSSPISCCEVERLGFCCWTGWRMRGEEIRKRRSIFETSRPGTAETVKSG
jgi:hypothetical protein